MDEGAVDREERRGARWRTFFLAAYCALVVYFLASDGLRMLGLMNLPLAAYFLSRSFVGTALDDVPYWFRRAVYRGWHGKYRAFDEPNRAVIERSTPVAMPFKKPVVLSQIFSNSSIESCRLKLS